MKKKWTKRIISILIAAVVIVTLGLVVFKRNFDKTVNTAAKELNMYTIDAELDGEAKKITASQKVELKNTFGTRVENIYFHLYPRAFRQEAAIKPYTTLNQGKCFSNGESYGNLEVSRVSVNGNEQIVMYAGEDENVLKVDFDFASGDMAEIKIDYVVTLPNCNHRFGYMDSNINLGNWYPILAHFSNGKFDLTPYYSTGDPFCSDMANFKVNLTCPSNLLCATTGNILSESVGSKKFLSIEAKAVRDFAIVLSSNFKLEEVKTKNTAIKYYGYEGDNDTGYIATMIENAFEFFNSKFGEYPYRQMSVVKTPFLYGGMEYPNLVMIADNLVENEDKMRVIIHEVAHQWWYGVVGNNEVTDAWIDESLTEYSSFLFFENFPNYGLNYQDLIEDAKNTYELYVDVITSLGGKVNYSMVDSVDKYASEYEYSYMIYVKGVIMYDDIRQTIGDGKFYKALQKYYKTYKFKIANGDGLIECFNKVYGKKLNDKFNSYLIG